ncbi:MAG TPA: TraR/DksA C4-type zinc finger protein [Acidimicrobiales bacterium]|nr:TraR/DksA C4-type zinc finger protein [Acidimicrobiales bacterium]
MKAPAKAAAKKVTATKAGKATKVAQPAKTTKTTKATKTTRTTKTTEKTPAKAAAAPAKKKAAAPAAPATTKKAIASKAGARTSAPSKAKAPKKAAPVTKTPPAAKTSPAPAPAKKSAPESTEHAAPPAPRRTLGVKPAPPARKSADHDPKFLEEQRELLIEERRGYERQIQELKAEADQLAAEAEPGDVQFDDESGEGDTMSIERERDLALIANARRTIEEIERALEKIDAGTYGICERCGQPIMKARLKALPFATECVACKSGGLSARR